MVVRWRHSGLLQKYPQRVHLSDKSGGKLTGGILIGVIACYQFDETGIEVPPLTGRWGFMGHMTESSQFGKGILTKFGYFFVRTLGKLLSIPDQVSQIGLTEPNPFRIER